MHIMGKKSVEDSQFKTSTDYRFLFHVRDKSEKFEKFKCIDHSPIRINDN